MLITLRMELRLFFLHYQMAFFLPCTMQGKLKLPGHFQWNPVLFKACIWKTFSLMNYVPSGLHRMTWEDYLMSMRATQISHYSQRSCRWTMALSTAGHLVHTLPELKIRKDTRQKYWGRIYPSKQESMIGMLSQALCSCLFLPTDCKSKSVWAVVVQTHTWCTTTAFNENDSFIILLSSGVIQNASVQHSL